MPFATSAFAARLMGGSLLLVAVAGVALAAASAPTIAQDGGARVEIHNRICPTGYEGTDPFEDCHDNPPDPGLPFTLTDGETREGTTDAEGNLAFDGLTEGTYTIQGGAPGDIAGTEVFCSLEQDLGNPYEFEYVTGGIQLFVPEGTSIICDWYNTPEDLRGETPVPTQPPTDGDGTLTLYKATCPPGYTGDDVFADCFENATADVQFVIGTTATDNVAAATTGADGLVTFELAPFLLGPESTITFGETTATGGADPVVVCTDAAGDQVEIVDTTTLQYEGSGPVFAVTIAPATDDEVRCDWYNIPPAQETPAPTPDPNARPAAIHEGDCDDIGDVVVELTGVGQPSGETVGNEAATLAATSFTVVDLSLDQLLDTDHAITVGEEGAAQNDAPAACGELGGVLDANGALVVGLREQAESDLVGIAYLEPNPDDPEQTQISVLVAEGLAEDTDDLDGEEGATPAA